MQLTIFGDVTPIDWAALGVKMPFAPMHELAKKYENELVCPEYFLSRFLPVGTTMLNKVFETDFFSVSDSNIFQLSRRIQYRTNNTISALTECTPDTICINLGGGYHHAGKRPDTGYAYSLINDIIWAVDYQLEQGKTIGIIDLDFHFGGGTWDYYKDWNNPYICDIFHPKGILHNHKHLIPERYGLEKLEVPFYIPTVDKILLNIGTDWLHSDPLFGKYGNMYDGDLLAVWTDTIHQIVMAKIPLAITMGGGYGSNGLPLYEQLISYLQKL